MAVWPFGWIRVSPGTGPDQTSGGTDISIGPNYMVEQCVGRQAHPSITSVRTMGGGARQVAGRPVRRGAGWEPAPGHTSVPAQHCRAPLAKTVAVLAPRRTPARHWPRLWEREGRQPVGTERGSQNRV